MTKLKNFKEKKRVEKICLFADYLCGLEIPFMKYDVLNECYTPVNEALKQLALNNKKTLLNNRKISTCSSTGSNTNGFEFDASHHLEDLNLDDEFSELKEKRRLLKLKMNEQEKRVKSHRNVLESSTQRRLELEVRPKFIVPDTNCFIDHLNLIEQLLATNYYIIIVPLLVINELDKLAKSISNYNDDSIEHAEYVQRNARKSIQFLTMKFEKRERNLKALTSQGSVMETIQFRSEELKSKV